MGKVMLVLAVMIAAGVWFWMQEEEKGPSKEEIQIQKNARLIKDCMRRESTLNAAAQKAGDDSVAVDSRALCAEKYNLYYDDGQWHRLNTNDNDLWAPR